MGVGELHGTVNPPPKRSVLASTPSLYLNWLIFSIHVKILQEPEVVPYRWTTQQNLRWLWQEVFGKLWHLWRQLSEDVTGIIGCSCHYIHWRRRQLGSRQDIGRIHFARPEGFHFLSHMFVPPFRAVLFGWTKLFGWRWVPHSRCTRACVWSTSRWVNPRWTTPLLWWFVPL